MALLESIRKLDQRIFLLINHEATHPWLDVFMPFWTDLHKNLFVIIPLILISAAWAWRKYGRDGIAVILGAFAASETADLLSSKILKPYFDRARPSSSHLGFDVVSRGIVYGGPSFPSSHAVGFCSFAAFICVFERRFVPVALILGAITCYSRVYCGDHFPSDVIVGAAIGAAIGVAIGVAFGAIFVRIAKPRP